MSTLDLLPIGKEAIVQELQCNGTIRRRLLDLGIVKGTKITSVFKSPSSDPTAFEIRGTILALRKEDSSLIVIKENNLS